MLHLPLNGKLWIFIGTAAFAVTVVIFLLIIWFHKRKQDDNGNDNDFQSLKSVHNEGKFKRYDTMSSSSSENDGIEAISLYTEPSATNKAQKESSIYKSLSPIHSAALGAIHSKLYSSSDEDEEEEEKKNCPHGRVWLSVFHDNLNERLIVFVAKAKYLPGKGISFNARSVFCRVYLLPDESNFIQSTAKKRTSAPKFNDTFIFQVAKREVMKKTLRISFYDIDKRKVRHSLGHLMIVLKNLDLNSNEIFYKDLEIQQRTTALGEVQIQLYCNPTSDRLRITISHISNIHGIKLGETGVYVKVELYHGKKMMRAKRTSMMKMMSPELHIDESFSFAVAGKHMENCSFCITLLLCYPSEDSEKIIEKNYGRVILGTFLFARGEQLSHWQDMMNNPRIAVVKRHKLEPCIGNETEIDMSKK